MASKYNKTRSLHGVTLPRSWLLENVQKLNRVKNKGANPRMLWHMIIPFRDLLERVYSANDTGGSSVEKLLPVT
jgi:hypothetical protein